MANLYELMLGDATDPEKMAMAAKALRRREALGTLAALTGDKVLSPWGKSQLEDVSQRTGKLMTARQQGQQVGEQKASRLQRALDAKRRNALGYAELDQRKQQAMFPRTLGAGRYSVGEDVRMVPGYEEDQALRHQQALELAQARGERSGGSDFEEWAAKERYKRSLPTATLATKAKVAMTFLPEIKSLSEELKGVSVPAIPESVANAVRSVPFGESIAPQIERMGMDKDAVRWLARGRQMESDIIRLASGLAVTGFELENVKKWSPFASNLNNEERQDRLQNVYNKLGREASATMNVDWTNWDSPTDAGSVEEIQTPEGSGWSVEVVPPGGA